MNKPPAPGRHPRAACSPDLGGPWVGAPARLSPISPSHRLSPLKVSAFFKRTLRPPALPGGVFLHKAAHICLRFFVQTGEFPQELFTSPHFVAFFCNKPPHFALWVKGLFHIHPPPSHGRDPPLKHFEMRACLRRAWRAGPGSIREPLLQASRALRPPAPGFSFHPPINRDRTLKAAYPAREPAQVAIIFVAFLQNPAKQPPFLCEIKIFCKISSF